MEKKEGLGAVVYDCFQFFNELDILKIRLNVLAPVVGQQRRSLV